MGKRILVPSIIVYKEQMNLRQPRWSLVIVLVSRLQVKTDLISMDFSGRKIPELKVSLLVGTFSSES